MDKVEVGKDVEMIEAKFDRVRDFKMDSKGYFLIRVNREKGIIEAGFCKKDNKIEKIIFGKTAREIFNTIIRKGLVGNLQHAADLGAELQKAEMALNKEIEYVQDESLDFEKKVV